MAKKDPSGIDESTLQAYAAVVGSIDGLPRKGKTMPYTSINGHMFSFLDKTGTLSLRLPKEEREAFLSDYDTTLSVQHGRVMKEYVLVPSALLHDLALLAPIFQKSYGYALSLKPKPSKK